MARKPKPFMVFETKEDFDKKFDEIYHEGRVTGFKDGSIWTLSYIQELLKDMFQPAAFKAAEDEIRSRKIEKWRKDEDAKSLKEELDFKNFVQNTIKDFAKGS